MVISVLTTEDDIEEALHRVREKKPTTDYFRPGSISHWSETDAASNSFPSTSTHHMANSTGPTYLRQEYTAAITLDKKKKKKDNNRKKSRGKNQKYSNFDDEPAAAQRQPNAYMDSGASQPSTSSRKKPKLFTVPKTPMNAPSYTSMADSRYTDPSAMWNPAEYFNKFYLVTVANARILKTIWKNRVDKWPFIIPASRFQQALIGKGVKIILFFYVPGIEKLYGCSELRITNGRASFHGAPGFTGARKWYTELP